MLNHASPAHHGLFLFFTMLLKRNITVIVVAMSLALSGLIGVQVYWIGNAIETEQEQLQYHVNSALAEVVDKLERQEYTNKIIRDRTVQQFVSGMNRKFDPPGIIQHDMSFVERDIVIQDSTISKDGQDIIVSIVRGTTNDSIKGIRTEAKVIRENVRKDCVSFANNSDFDGIQTIDIKLVPQELIVDRVNMVSDILVKVFDEEMYQPIQERINVSTVDSMLEAELANAGIEQTYKFAIADQDGNNYAFKDQTVNRYDTELKSAQFKLNLFPDDLNELAGKTNFLLVNIGNETGYLLKQLWPVLLLSALFIAVIGLAFYYTISTILKQKKVSAIKSDFINNMTHELKTPISTISLACEALNDPDINHGSNLNNNYVSMIKEENTRLGILVERVLQSAVIEKGELKLRQERIDIHKIIEKVIDKFRMQINKLDGKVVLDLHAAHSSMVGDKMHITNMFYNLVDNAIKYTSGDLYIGIHSRNDNGSIVIDVEDKGIGIGPAHQKRIFENLYRVPTGNIHDVKGFGLGLSYVNAIVDSHNGQIDLKSQLGQGSIFTIKLPTQTDYEKS